MGLLLTEILVLVLVVTVNGQWVIQNHTVVNTTYYGHPGYPAPIPQGPPPGFISNNIGTKFINPQQPGYGFVRNATGYNNSFAVKNNGNNLLVGTPGPGDVILFKEYFSKPSRWLQIREKNIEYPMYPTTAKYRITAVHVLDMSKTPGGHANILAGGVGYSFVTIRLFSERSRGFSYKVNIYGHNF